MTREQCESGPVVVRRRHWPWFLLGLILGNCNADVRTVSHPQPVVFRIEGVASGGNGAGSVGIWDEGTQSVRHRIFLQSGTLVFTVADELEATPPVIGWTVTAEPDAPFTVTQTDPAWDIGTSSATGRFTITLNRCGQTDERSWPLTIARTGDGDLGPSEVVEVIPQCGHPLNAADTIVTGP